MELNNLNLIRLIKARPEIYQKSGLNAFENPVRAKENAWMDISETLQVDVNVLKKRWRTLRDQFQRHFKKVQLLDGEKIEIQWPYFEKLLFLKDNYKSNEVSINVKSIERFEESESTSQVDYDEEEIDRSIDLKCNFSEQKSTIERIGDSLPAEFSDQDCNNYYLETPNKLEIENYQSENDCDINVMDKRHLKNNSSRKRKSTSQSRTKRSKNSEANNHTDFEVNDLDREIQECLACVRSKVEKPPDHIDHFCNFIGSMIRQWSKRKQLEAIQFFTNYTLKNHENFKDRDN